MPAWNSDDMTGAASKQTAGMAVQALLARPAVQWLVLLYAVTLLLFAQINQARIYGDSIPYAAQARAMAESGDYFTLRFGQEANHHGPLLFWLTAAAIDIFGPSPFSMTLISRLFALGCVIMVAWLGRQLFDRKVAWLGALVLATTYTFWRNAVVLRMDTGLTLGFLLAMSGYWNGARRWGPPLFFCGVALAILAKAVPGVLPVGVSALHALASRRLAWPWRRAARRWLIWSPLLLLALAWWGYLAWQYGAAPFNAMIEDLLSEERKAPRLSQFAKVYVLEFGTKYWPWLPFASLGIWQALRSFLRVKENSDHRSAFLLLLLWLFVVLVSAGLKTSQYERYLVPALPAVALLAAVAIVHLLDGTLPLWLPGGVAVCSLVAGLAIACVSSPADFGDAIRHDMAVEILAARLPKDHAIPVITTLVDEQQRPRLSWMEDARPRLFLRRAPQPISIAQAKEMATQHKLIALISKHDYPAAARELGMLPWLRTHDYWLVELGSDSPR